MSDPAGQIRYAIERGEFVRALELWQQWSAGLTVQIQAGTLDPAEWARAGEIYHWSRNVLLGERAHLLERLNTAHAAGAYGPPTVATDPTLIRGRF